MQGLQHFPVTFDTSPSFSILKPMPVRDQKFRGLSLISLINTACGQSAFTLIYVKEYG